MHKTAQAWFGGGPSSSSTINGGDLQKQPPSLLADWNAYASSKDTEDPDSGLGFDLEAAVRTANDKVSGTFNVYVYISHLS